jgi:hypothetical protein
MPSIINPAHIPTVDYGPQILHLSDVFHSRSSCWSHIFHNFGTKPIQNMGIHGKSIHGKGERCGCLDDMLVFSIKFSACIRLTVSLPAIRIFRTSSRRMV